MGTRDIIHDPVKRALIKSGWEITADPLVIDYDDLMVFADLAADRPLAAQRGTERIAVEIKSFVGMSAVRDFEFAIGQYQLYRSLLEVTDPARMLFLAVSEAIFAEFFERPAIRLVVRRYQIACISVDVEREEVVRWIDWRNIEP
ncbi:MAG: XisH family protein [Pirellulaceae bacterium]|nr:XisH family protein [Planctomycetales bacterium]MCA9162951.1 XisH family protein [Planctomycetales bacterium]MCA9208849.1 XisH family protein [Planctomycetales bacterium]